MRPPSQPCPLAFLTIDSLAAFLLLRLSAFALASWGTAPSTKTLLNLFLELSYGDYVLLPAVDQPRAQHPAVVRAIHVATVLIRNRSSTHLVETQQLLSDGTLRRRGPRPLSEKMHPGESPEAAVARAVREELGERVRVWILGDAGGAEVEPRVEERESASYPGLPARFMLHAVDAEVVEGMQVDDEFKTEETSEDEGEGGGGAITVKRHYWKWVDDDEDHMAAATSSEGVCAIGY